jgi:hypothetical protein
VHYTSPAERDRAHSESSKTRSKKQAPSRRDSAVHSQIKCENITCETLRSAKYAAIDQLSTFKLKHMLFVLIYTSKSDTHHVVLYVLLIQVCFHMHQCSTMMIRSMAWMILLMGVVGRQKMGSDDTCDCTRSHVLCTNCDH